MSTGTRISVAQTQRLRLTPSLHASMQVLRVDAAGLARFLEEQAAETPALGLVPSQPPLGEWLPRWSGVLAHDAFGRAEATMEGPEPSLIAHVLAAIDALVPPKSRPIAFALAETLEPTGWLGRDPAAVARDMHIAVAEVEAVLKHLQKIEPAGLFARDLAECLRLQAEDTGCLDAVMGVMLGRLDLVASGDWGALAALATASEAEIAARFRLIRSFDPKPGAGFSAVSSPLREPDLTVRQGGAGWEVSLNRSSLPTLSVVEGAEGAVRAREVIALVENRNATLLAVAQAVLAHQSAALEAGPRALRPLGMQAVAEAVGLHKSTVSRVVAGAGVDTPHGTWWLRSLFSCDMGGDVGAVALRARLARMISAEDPRAPLSDEALAQALRGDGPVIARRTVAKYRAALRIPPAHRRRMRS